MPCEINQISNDKHLGKINSESLNAAVLVTGLHALHYKDNLSGMRLNPAN